MDALSTDIRSIDKYPRHDIHKTVPTCHFVSDTNPSLCQLYPPVILSALPICLVVSCTHLLCCQLYPPCHVVTVPTCHVVSCPPVCCQLYHPSMLSAVPIVHLSAVPTYHVVSCTHLSCWSVYPPVHVVKLYQPVMLSSCTKLVVECVYLTAVSGMCV